MSFKSKKKWYPEKMHKTFNFLRPIYTVIQRLNKIIACLKSTKKLTVSIGRFLFDTVKMHIFLSVHELHFNYLL